MTVINNSPLKLHSQRYNDWLSTVLATFFQRQQLQFAFVSGMTFVLLTGVMYCRYGYTFLHETYLYHVTRTDHRHNFSVYFYMLYLMSGDGEAAVYTGSMYSKAIGLLAFLPQMVLLVWYAFWYCYPIPSATAVTRREKGRGLQREGIGGEVDGGGEVGECRGESIELRDVRNVDLAFCLFAQTFTFVVFNKVCTVQVPIYLYTLASPLPHTYHGL